MRGKRRKILWESLINEETRDQVLLYFIGKYGDIVRSYDDKRIFRMLKREWKNHEI